MRKIFLRSKKKYKIFQRRRTRRFRLTGRQPIVVPLVTFAVLLFFSALTWQFVLKAEADTPHLDARVVIISHDHQEQTVPSKESTVGELLAKLNIVLNEGDVVEPSQDTRINQDDFRINVYRALPVEVIDGSQRKFAFSAATTSRSIAKQAGVTIYPEDDLVTEPSTDFLKDHSIGPRVVIDRATPVKADLYGNMVTLRTHAKTVGELLDEKGVKPKKGDTIRPALSAPVGSGMRVEVIRNGTRVLSSTEEIPMPVKTIYDTNLAYGTSAVRQQGSPGKKIVTYQVKAENGREVSRTILQTIITERPVTQIVALGVNLGGIKGDMALAGIAPSDYSYVDYIISRESGWCPTKWQGEYGGCPAYHGTPSGELTGYGLCQATPGWKMASAGSDWATNPITQLKWCSSYATERHGSWRGAYDFWIANNWW